MIATSAIKFDTVSQRLLFKESSLSALNLATGLTFIRKFDFIKYGYFYQSCFSLSIGIERLLKIIIIYEYYAIHGRFPEAKYLKKKGHNLVELFQSVKDLFLKYNSSNQLNEVQNEPICIAILHNLTDFAINNRYSHLDELTALHPKSEDPLKRWDREVHESIVRKHYFPNSDYEKELEVICQRINEFSTFNHHNEQDKLIKTYKGMFREGLTISIKQKYNVYYTFILVKALCRLQEEQNRFHYSNACLYEFFTTFRVRDKKQALAKKNWDPYTL